MKQASGHEFCAKARSGPADREARALSRFEREPVTADAVPRNCHDLEQINVWLATDLRISKREITRPSNGGPLLRVIFKPEPHSPQTD